MLPGSPQGQTGWSSPVRLSGGGRLELGRNVVGEGTGSLVGGPAGPKSWQLQDGRGQGDKQAVLK